MASSEEGMASSEEGMASSEEGMAVFFSLALIATMSKILIIIIIILVVLLALLVLLTEDRVEKILTHYVGGAEESFPYWAKSLPPAKKMFTALKLSHLQTTTDGGNPVLLRAYPGDYMKSDAISNHYTEEARIVCRAGQAPTPLEVWHDIRGHASLQGLPPASLRETIYSRTRECNIFNPAFARWVIEKTVGSGARILDPSSGWGDRLIGALAAKAKSYHGFDPNPRLYKGYRQIVKELGGDDQDSFRVTEAPFEDMLPAAKTYDLAFTSPPYFAYEEYVEPGAAGEETQSIGRHPKYDEWVAKMYRPYLANAVRAVRPGGWVVLYIEDIRLKGQQYPLRRLTEEIMIELGAKMAGRFGLRVANRGATAPARQKKRRARTRWAQAWRIISDH